MNLVLVKDLSRFGRDYIGAGEYLEKVFPLQQVRVIAINDGFDSLEKSAYQMLAIKNVFNEMYARDISDKIVTALQAKMQAGCYIGNFAPYGYKKDAKNKNKLIVNAETAPVVKKIFQWAGEGESPLKIADVLNRKQILAPFAYRQLQYTKVRGESAESQPRWTAATIGKMLKNPVYLGHLAQGKTQKVSFKLNKLLPVAAADWIVVKHTHEALIRQEDFDMAMQMRRNRTCHKQGSFTNLFSGIAKCKDCGRKMSAVGSRKKDSPMNLACGGYKAHGVKACTNHFIEYRALYAIVLHSLREALRLDEQERAKLLNSIESRYKETLKKAEPVVPANPLRKRQQELDCLIKKLYEDYSQGFLTELRLRKMVEQYEREYKSVSDTLQISSAKADEQAEIDQFIPIREKIKQRIEAYTKLPQLTAMAIAKFIDVIEIEQGSYEKVQGKRVKRQTVHLYFRFHQPTDKRFSLHLDADEL